jgi:ADP-heptose:LPS heptosyltransferase
MNLKLLKLRVIIFVWKFFGNVRKVNSKNQFNSSNEKNKNVLIVFPIDEPSFRVASYTFRDLGKNKFNNKQFTFIIREDFRDFFHFQFGQPLFIKCSENKNVLSEEKKLLHSLNQNTFDFIIDLNPYFQLSVSRFLSFLESDLKIGFVSEFSDEFYNMQLDVSKSGIMEKGFKQISRILNQ